MKRKFVTAALVGALVTIPLQNVMSDEEPPKDDWLLAACIVAVAGLAVGAVYICSKKCEPKWYWHCDNDNPPNFWVGTSSRKQCDIEGWHRIGGPYKTAGDAPTIHPNATNRVELVSGPIQTIKVQQTTNLVDWTTVSEFRGDDEDFVYYPTNQGMFRLEIAP